MNRRNANEKVIQYNKKKPVNVWILVSILVFIYLIIYFCFYAFNSRVSFVEVTEGSTTGRFDTQYTALAIRDEKKVNVDEDGYINFFVGDGAQIFVGEDTYMLDKKGDISAKLEEYAKNNAVLNGNDMDKLKDSIYDFDTAFDDQNFYDSYSFKSKLESQILDLMSTNIFDVALEEIGDPSNYHIFESDYNGVVLHNIDGFEELSYKDIESSYFKKSNYKKKIVASNDFLNKGDTAYKVITDDQWYLVFQIEDPSEFEGIKYMDIVFLKDNISTSCEFQTFTKAGNTYGVLTLKKYMIRYISDRFLQIKLYEDYYEGLKIPKSSVLEKQVFVIPREYLTQGGNSNAYGFMRKNDENNIEFITPSIVLSDAENVYVTTDNGILSSNDVLARSDSLETFTVSRKENKEGVYAISNGYATFKIIEVLGEHNNYYIINPKSGNGIRLYDMVIEDYQSIEEGQEVY